MSYQKLNHMGIAVAVLSVFASGCTEEQQNKLSRMGVTWLEGNYKVTYAQGSHVKTWVVQDGKVTSEPEKGYYFFWIQVDGKSMYVQTPIENSYIEEFK